MTPGRVPGSRLLGRANLGALGRKPLGNVHEFLAATAVVSGVAAALFVLLCWQGEAAGQEEERDCTLVGVGGYTVSRRADSIHYTHRASGGIDYRCTDGTRILADSAVVWERSGNLFLVERVHFEDPDTELDADSARYFGNVRELHAWSGVTLTDRKSDAVLMGDSLIFQRASRFRAMDRIRVYGGYPRAVVYPARRPAAPVAASEPVGAPRPEGLGGEGGVPAPDSVPEEPPGELAADSLTDETPGELSADSMMEGPPAEPPADSGPPDPPGSSPQEGPGDTPTGVADGPGDAEDATPPDSVTPTPYEVEAPRLYIDGRQFFRAGGGVVVTRDSLQAFGDSLDYDQEVGAMLIFGDAHVVDRGFELKGVSVSVTPAAGLNEEILAREEAELTGDQVLMSAPAIRLFLDGGQVTRIVALPSVVPLPGDEGDEMADTAGLTPGDVARARALAERARREAEGDSVIAPDSLPRPSVVAADFNLTGDSIDVLSPNQLLDVVTAIGGARADAMSPDTVLGEDLPDIIANDWIEGESIVARFKAVEPAEDSLAAGRDTTAGRVRLESVTATTNARSLYRVLTTDTAREESDTATTESDTAMVEPDTAMSNTVTAESEAAQPATDIAGAESGDTGAETGTPPVEPGPDAGDPDAPPAQAGTDPGETDVAPASGDTLQGEEVRPPALHYVRGNQITIHMEGRKVVRMEVQGQTVGFHFEPLPPDSLSAAEDSAAPALDTVAIPPDTANAADTVSTPPDTASAAEDTTVIPPDTTNAARDTTTPQDTTRLPPDTSHVPTPARRETPRSPGSNGFRRGFHPPLHRRPTGTVR